MKNFIPTASIRIKRTFRVDNGDVSLHFFRVDNHFETERHIENGLAVTDYSLGNVQGRKMSQDSMIPIYLSAIK